MKDVQTLIAPKKQDWVQALKQVDDSDSGPDNKQASKETIWGYFLLYFRKLLEDLKTLTNSEGPELQTAKALSAFSDQLTSMKDSLEFYNEQWQVLGGENAKKDEGYDKQCKALWDQSLKFYEAQAEVLEKRLTLRFEESDEKAIQVSQKDEAVIEISALWQNYKDLRPTLLSLYEVRMAILKLGHSLQVAFPSKESIYDALDAFEDKFWSLLEKLPLDDYEDVLNISDKDIDAILEAWEQYKPGRWYKSLTNFPDCLHNEDLQNTLHEQLSQAQEGDHPDLDTARKMSKLLGLFELFKVRRGQEKILSTISIVQLVNEKQSDSLRYKPKDGNQTDVLSYLNTCFKKLNNCFANIKRFIQAYQEKDASTFRTMVFGPRHAFENVQKAVVEIRQQAIKACVQLISEDNLNLYGRDWEKLTSYLTLEEAGELAKKFDTQVDIGEDDDEEAEKVDKNNEKAGWPVDGKEERSAGLDAHIRSNYFEVPDSQLNQEGEINPKRLHEGQELKPKRNFLSKHWGYRSSSLGPLKPRPNLGDKIAWSLFFVGLSFLACLFLNPITPILGVLAVSASIETLALVNTLAGIGIGTLVVLNWAVFAWKNSHGTTLSQRHPLAGVLSIALIFATAGLMAGPAILGALTIALTAMQFLAIAMGSAAAIGLLLGVGMVIWQKPYQKTFLSASDPRSTYTQLSDLSSGSDVVDRPEVDPSSKGSICGARNARGPR